MYHILTYHTTCSEIGILVYTRKIPVKISHCEALAVELGLLEAMPQVRLLPSGIFDRAKPLGSILNLEHGSSQNPPLLEKPGLCRDRQSSTH